MTGTAASGGTRFIHTMCLSADPGPCAALRDFCAVSTGVVAARPVALPRGGHARPRRRVCAARKRGGGAGLREGTPTFFASGASHFRSGLVFVLGREQMFM